MGWEDRTGGQGGREGGREGGGEGGRTGLNVLVDMVVGNNTPGVTLFATQAKAPKILSSAL